MKKTILALFVLSAVVTFSPAQTGHEEETKSDIAELNQMHVPIAQLWHTAWPKKDIVLMQKLMPDLEARYQSLARVMLPGILRDKKSQWNQKIREYGVTITNFKNALAVNSTDTATILMIAESVHSQYEGLVRLVKPMLKELDSFHQTLYMLYHYYLPEHDQAKIEKSIAEIALRMDTLNAVSLYKEMDEKSLTKAYPDMGKDDIAKVLQKRTMRTEKFVEARKQLSTAVDAVKETIKLKKEASAVESAIQTMHAAYENLEKVFN